MAKKESSAAANRLRMLRAERRLTQLDVARRLKLSQATYWQVENGFRDASERERAALARIFDVDESALGFEAQAS